MNNFLPKDYEVPSNQGNYYKLSKGENRFRIMGPALVGFEYWNTANKPIRSTEPWDERPEDMKEGGTIKHFWAFPVYNYEAKKVQIMEITQKSIQGAIQAYVENKKWGDPIGYDFVVTRTGDGLETEYTVITEPHSPAPKADASSVNVAALLTGSDPFAAKSDTFAESIDPANFPAF